MATSALQLTSVSVTTGVTLLKVRTPSPHSPVRFGLTERTGTVNRKMSLVAGDRKSTSSCAGRSSIGASIRNLKWRWSDPASSSAVTTSTATPS